MEDLERQLKEFKLQITYKAGLKRINLRLQKNKIISVTSPRSVSRNEILNFVYRKSNWILKHTDFINQNSDADFTTTYLHQSLIPFRGENWILFYQTQSTGSATVVPDWEQKQLLIRASARILEQPEKVKKIVIQWIYNQAQSEIHKKVAYYASLLKVQPRAVYFKNYRSRWGACNSKAELFFNWQIIGFSDRLLDYVVAHELCHILEMNHSPRFYQLLQNLGFDVKEVHDLMRTKQNIYTG